MTDSMKQYLKGLYMSCSMFCVIPLKPLWDESCVHYILSALPLIGGILGAVWWGAAKLLLITKVPLILSTAVVSILPFLFTGFLHLDGYMDTSDAILSRRPYEEKLRILKDPHTGAFAVIMLAILFVLQCSAVYVVLEKELNLNLFLVIPIISRCCSSMSIFLLKAMPQSGYATMFQQNVTVRSKLFVMFIFIVVIVVSVLCLGVHGLVIILAGIISYLFAMRSVYKEFHGISGDLAGYALVISELSALAAAALV